MEEEPRVFAQHALLSVAARTEVPPLRTGVEGEHTLFGVNYRYSARDLEFGESGNDANFRNFQGERTRECCLFLRLLARDAGRTRLFVRSLYEYEPNQWRVMMAIPARWENPIGFPERGEDVQDLVVRLPYLRIGGIGLHAITVHFRSEFDPEYDDSIEPTEEIDESRPWQDADEWQEFPGFHHLATEYFEIVRTQA
jgi:hypothetical protein